MIRIPSFVTRTIKVIRVRAMNVTTSSFDTLRGRSVVGSCFNGGDRQVCSTTALKSKETLLPEYNMFKIVYFCN